MCRIILYCIGWVARVLLLTVEAGRRPMFEDIEKGGYSLLISEELVCCTVQHQAKHRYMEYLPVWIVVFSHVAECDQTFPR